MRRALYLLATCALAAAVALPAAAAPATSPDQLLKDAMAAATAASTVHVSATGIPSGSSTTSWDFRLVAGRGGAGSMTLGKDKIDLIRIGPFAYFRAGAPFWRKNAGKTAAQLFAGQWVKMSAANASFRDLISLTDIKQFFTGILSSHGTLKLGGTKTIDGAKAIGLVDTGSGGGTLYIAAAGTPYPLQLTPASGPGVVNFESWNAPTRIAAPHEFIDFSKLKK